jgi:hypothetical protein
MDEKRRCKYPGCTTDLNRYHKGDYCYDHEKEGPALERYTRIDKPVEKKSSREWISLSELAQQVPYSDRKLRQMLIDGEIQGFQIKPHGKWIIESDEVEKLIRGGIEKEKPRAKISEAEIEQQSKPSPDQVVLVRQHDIEIFNKSDAIMSEAKLKNFLWPLDGGPPIYYYSQADYVSQYLDFFSYVGNQYIDTELKTINQTLCDALTELGTFLHHEFRTPDRITHGDEKYSRLIPGELSHMHYSGEGDMEDDKRYWNYFEQLQTLNNKCKECFNKYRIYISETLFL